MRIPEPFDHPEWIYELKLDGFRSIAKINGHRCQLISATAIGSSTILLAEDLAHAIRRPDF